MAKDADLRGYDITQSNTLYLPRVKRFYIQDGKLIEHKNFLARNNTLTSIIKSGEFKYVVLGASFASHQKAADQFASADKPLMTGLLVFEKQIEEAVQIIFEAGATPVFIKGNPTYSSDIQNCTLNNQRFNLTSKCDMDVEQFKLAQRDWSVTLGSLLKKYPSIIVIDPAQIICDTLRCHTELKGIPIYRDRNHLNYMGSELIGELYLQKFENPFKPPESKGSSSTPEARLNDHALTSSAASVNDPIP